MKQWDDLTVEEKFKAYNNAFTYLHDHADHVNDLLIDAFLDYAVAPSGSDMFHPELWKPIHWKWFKERLES